jgi:hypothetical protein
MFLGRVQGYRIGSTPGCYASVGLESTQARKNQKTGDSRQNAEVVRGHRNSAFLSGFNPYGIELRVFDLRRFVTYFEWWDATSGRILRNKVDIGRFEMRRPIQDEFTKMPISRQRKYQLRKQRQGRCTECGEPAAQGSRCLKHLVKARERQRKKRGLKRRYYNTLSYRLEAAA